MPPVTYSRYAIGDRMVANGRFAPVTTSFFQPCEWLLLPCGFNRWMQHPPLYPQRLGVASTG